MISRYFDDDPVDGGDAPDLLGRDGYAQYAVGLLGRVRAQSESGVLALIGSWGSGKSSLLNMITRRLGADGGWAVAELNPWMHSGVGALTEALFAEIREVLPKEARWSVARERLAGYGRMLAGASKVAAVAGVDASVMLEGVSERIEGDQSPSAAKKKVEESLRKTDRPILVVMDDLDRLTPVELLTVFKLVRLVGKLPNVYYLLCYDERTLLDVLQRTDLVGADERRAQEFLEKIIQVRLDLPAFREKDAAAMVDRAVTEILQDHGMLLQERDTARLAQAYYAHLQDRLTTPRSIKRYFAQVDAGLVTVSGEVDFVDFMIVTFLRTVEPGVFRMIARSRAELTGTAFLPRPRPSDPFQVWSERVAAANVAEQHREGVMSLLAMLFPLVGGSGQSRAGTCGIQHADYFDRYTMFAVPEDDLSEAEFTVAVRQLGAGAAGPESAELRVRARTDTHRIVRRLQRARASDPGTFPYAEAAVFLSEVFGELEAPAEGGGLLSPQSSVRAEVTDLLAALPPERRVEVVEGIATTSHGTGCVHGGGV